MHIIHLVILLNWGGGERARSVFHTSLSLRYGQMRMMMTTTMMTRMTKSTTKTNTKLDTKTPTKTITNTNMKTTIESTTKSTVKAIIRTNFNRTSIARAVRVQPTPSLHID